MRPKLIISFSFRIILLILFTIIIGTAKQKSGIRRRLAGECYRLTPRAHCVCCHGWWGSCGSCKPTCLGGCYNGGICRRPNQCQCLDGFSGRRCARRALNKVSASYCSPGCIHGTCVAKDGKHVCECGKTWTGPTCESRKHYHRDCLWIWKISSTSGNIMSPNHRFRAPYYWSHMNCSQTLTGANAMFVKLTFLEFNLERDCRRDRLEIWSGKIEDGQLLRSVCGNKLPDSIGTFTNCITLRMISDGSVSGSGFRVEYNFYGNGFAAGECRRKVYARDLYAATCRSHKRALRVHGIPCSRFLGYSCSCCPGYSGSCGACQHAECNTPILKTERYVTKCGWLNCYRMRQRKIGHQCRCCDGFVGSCLSKCRPYSALPTTHKSPNAQCGRLPVTVPQDENVFRIYGGSAQPYGAWPWLVRINRGDRLRCGATLISDRWLLGAAHCFDTRTPYPDLKLFIGDFHTQHQEYRELRTRPKRIIVPRWYESWSLRLDIALIELVKPVTFNERIQAVCLPEAHETFFGELCFVAGWGITERGASLIPREARVRVIPRSTCRSMMPLLSQGVELKGQVCAGLERGKDTCSGDSGGPLVCKREGQWVLVGITSWGFGCGSYPGVYTDVATYAKWIQAKIIQNPL